MRLTIIAPESVYEHEVDPSMEIRDVKALVEAEVRSLLRFPSIAPLTCSWDTDCSPHSFPGALY